MKTTYEFADFFHNKYPGEQGNNALALEQAFKKSKKEKYCAECASTENLILMPASSWIGLEYYQCKECNDYWKNKG
jgi:hypothetical protein